MPTPELVSPNAIIPALKVNGKKQALQEIAAKAATLTGQSERSILEILLQREKLQARRHLLPDQVLDLLDFLQHRLMQGAPGPRGTGGSRETARQAVDAELRAGSLQPGTAGACNPPA